MNLINKILIVIIAIVAFYAIFLIYSDLNLVKDRLGEFKVEFLPSILTLVVLGWFAAFYRWILLLKQSNIKIPILENLLEFKVVAIIHVHSVLYLSVEARVKVIALKE